MRRLPIGLLLAAVPLIARAGAAPVVPAGAGQATAADSALADTLITLEKGSWVAWKARDGSYFARFLSADHVEVGRSGVTGKAAIVAFVGSDACVVRDYTVDRFAMTRLNGETAVLTYHAAQETTCGGARVPSPSWAASTFVLRDGRWQNAIYQQTPADS